MSEFEILEDFKQRNRAREQNIEDSKVKGDNQ